jgi:hypothetical protein
MYIYVWCVHGRLLKRPSQSGRLQRWQVRGARFLVWGIGSSSSRQRLRLLEDAAGAFTGACSPNLYWIADCVIACLPTKLMSCQLETSSCDVAVLLLEPICFRTGTGSAAWSGGI